MKHLVTCLALAFLSACSLTTASENSEAVATSSSEIKWTRPAPRTPERCTHQGQNCWCKGNIIDCRGANFPSRPAPLTFVGPESVDNESVFFNDDVDVDYFEAENEGE